VPNAFATGRSKNHAVVAVTTALNDQLSTPELEAVIAHELTHIINRDMLVMTLATFFSMVAALLIQNMFWLSGGRRRNNEQTALALLLVVSLATYMLSFLLIRALSRYRELAADRGGALITGAPEHLSTALIHIDEIVHGPTGARIPEQDFRQAQAVSALCIMPVVEGNPLATLLATHPSLEQRLEQMRRMQRQMEAMPVGEAMPVR
jgi:heat shock protein HtpX